MASSDGTLRATLKWEGPSRGVYDPSLFLVSPNGAWVYSEDPWPERRLRFQGSTGQTYRIVVVSYQPPQVFEVLRALGPLPRGAVSSVRCRVRPFGRARAASIRTLAAPGDR